MEKRITVKRVLHVLSAVLLYLFLSICILALVLTIASKKDSDGAASLFGYQMRIVVSDSMAECEFTDVSAYEIKSIPIRSMVFVQTVPEDESKAQAWYDGLQVGDVLTFRYVYTSQVTVTHRITSIAETEGGYLITLAGDNKNSDSGQLTQIIDTSAKNSPNYVIGKVVGQSRMLGWLFSLLKEPLGLVFTVIVPCFIIILLEVIKIVGMVHTDRKQREQEEQRKKDSEIEELRRRLAALEQQGGAEREAPIEVPWQDMPASESAEEGSYPLPQEEGSEAEKAETEADEVREPSEPDKQIQEMEETGHDEL